MALLDLLNIIEFTSDMIAAPLGLIEAFSPATADRIEEFIDGLETRMKEVGDKFTGGKLYEVSFSFAVPVNVYLIYYWIMSYSPLGQPEHSALFWISAALLTTPAYTGIFFYLLSGLIKAMNDLTGGRALGGISAVLIVVGFISDTIPRLL